MESIHVHSIDDWSRVNEALDDFSDGAIKEVRFCSSDWLGHDDNLRYGEGADLQVVVQLQTSDIRSAVLSFRGVARLEIDPSLDVYPAAASQVSPATWRVEFLSCAVEAESCLVTPTGDTFLGQGPFIQPIEP